jgi:hypothetical protein
VDRSATDAWQRIEDGHVTMLLPLSRHVLSFLSTNRFGELLAEPIELLFRSASWRLTTRNCTITTRM